MTSQRNGIDPRGPRFGQALTGSIALAAFLVNAPVVVGALTLVLGAGSVLGYRFNLWAKLYKRLVRPWLSDPDELEHPDPPRFAMCLGFVFTAAGWLVLEPLGPFVDAWIGWTPVLIVSGLALFAAATDICVGCEFYVLVQRWRRDDRETEVAT